MDSTAVQHPQQPRLALLTIGALGIVFGDIGTSPLYAVRECLRQEGGVALGVDNILGVLALIFWALVVVISIKYVSFLMRADNRGEGGVLALVALVISQRGKLAPNSRVAIFGLIGAALMFGDGILTPAMTVLSAVEGLSIATPRLTPYVIPATVVILVGLFSLQRQGTARVSALFGPVMLLWFATLTAVGIHAITREPAILRAFNPYWALRFFSENGLRGFLILGAVFLAVTGGEALYADMGHLGKKPIRLAWFAVAFPALVINYFGQGALLLLHPEAVENPFYLLAPTWALYPFVGLATMASVIASQAVITGAFSLTHQALQLDYVPRLKIQHSSAAHAGQIYVPTVNWMLLFGSVALVLAFRSSTNLAGAYGVAVSALMVISTLLAYAWAQSRQPMARRATALALVLLVVDVAFLSAIVAKIGQGGWVPLLIAALVYAFMSTWRQGRALVAQELGDPLPVDLFMNSLEKTPQTRVAGTAVFMGRNANGVPHTLLHNLKHNKVLHQQTVFLTVRNHEVPRIPKNERLEVLPIGPGMSRIVAHYGFMETPNVPEILQNVEAISPLRFDPMQTTFFLGRETVVWKRRSKLPRWRRGLFDWMLRNAQSATAHFDIPPNRAIELGAQIAL